MIMRLCRALLGTVTCSSISAGVKEGARGGTLGSPTLWDEYRVQLTQWEMDRYLAVL